MVRLTVALLSLLLSGCAGLGAAAAVMQGNGQAYNPPAYYVRPVHTQCINFGDFVDCTTR